MSTGFKRFDELTGGLHPGELIIVAGRPAMGKTALALNIAQYAAVKLKKTVAVFSLEMSKESLLTRLLCAGARVDSHQFRLGYLDQEERRRLQSAAAELVDAPLYIDDTSGSNLMDMHAKLRKLQGGEASRFGGARLSPVDERAGPVRKPGSGNQLLHAA